MACKKKSKASLYNHDVQLAKYTEGAADAHGGFSAATYTNVRIIWCAVKPLRGVERLANSKITEIVDNVFITDYMSVKDLLEAADRSEWKLTFKSIDYDIRHMINVDEADEKIEIYAKRGTGV